MSKLNYNRKTFLSKEELTQEQGFRMNDLAKIIVVNASSSFGIVSSNTQDYKQASFPFQLRNDLSATGTFTIEPGYAIDADGNVITIPSRVTVDMTQVASGYKAVTLKYSTRNWELGTVSISPSGALTGVGTSFTKVLRSQGSLCPVNVKFEKIPINDNNDDGVDDNALLNNAPYYEVTSVSNDTLAGISSSSSLVSETRLRMIVLGTLPIGEVFTQDQLNGLYSYDYYDEENLLRPMTSSSALPDIDETREFFLGVVNYQNGLPVEILKQGSASSDDTVRKYWSLSGSAGGGVGGGGNTPGGGDTGGGDTGGSDDDDPSTPGVGTGNHTVKLIAEFRPKDLEGQVGEDSTSIAYKINNGPMSAYQREHTISNVGPKDTIVLSARVAPPMFFSTWRRDSDDAILGSEATYTLTKVEENVTYKAVYGSSNTFGTKICKDEIYLAVGDSFTSRLVLTGLDSNQPSLENCTAKIVQEGDNVQISQTSIDRYEVSAKALGDASFYVLVSEKEGGRKSASYKQTIHVVEEIPLIPTDDEQITKWTYVDGEGTSFEESDPWVEWQFERTTISGYGKYNGAVKVHVVAPEGYSVYRVRSTSRTPCDVETGHTYIANDSVFPHDINGEEISALTAYIYPTDGNSVRAFYDDNYENNRVEITGTNNVGGTITVTTYPAEGRKFVNYEVYNKDGILVRTVTQNPYSFTVVKDECRIYATIYADD